MTISFKHSYDKLKAREFTTIRSKAFAIKAEKAEVVSVTTPDGKFDAIVDAVRVIKIKDIPFALLQADVAPHRLITKDCFVEFLNSLRAPFWAQATLDSEMAIITLRKV